MYFMKKFLLILWMHILASIAVGAQSARHVILISIDGFRPEFYLDASWNAPNLRKLKAEGVYAKGVRSVFPSVTYPSHTTIVTGAYPAKHGIYYNVPYGEKSGHWYWEESYIKTPTLWDAVKTAGLTSAAVMWPVTVGAPIDYNFPVKRADNDEKTDQLSVTLPHITPKGLMDEIQKNATGTLKPDDFIKDDRMDRTIGKMGAYIFKTYRPNLMALHFLSLDHMQHEYGREGEAVQKALTLVDSMIGAVMQTVVEAGLQSSTAVIVTGDHGFVTTSQSIAPNVLLAQNGLLSKEGWKAKFHGAGGASFLYLKDKNDHATVEKVKQVLNSLPADQKKLFRIVDRGELDREGANPEVALALSMSKGVSANNALSGPLVEKKKKGGTHGYLPDFDEINTGFIAVGAGIEKQKVIRELGVKDIAPLISGLLRLPFTAPDGILVPGILTQSKKK
jgi:predicted AlkP superfamily pyrophosphatase or phosphodiesterase